MYYRVAVQTCPEACLEWKTTPLSSLDALFRMLRRYSALPLDSFRVFKASSREELNSLLSLENDGLMTSSETAADFLCERKIRSLGTLTDCSQNEIKQADNPLEPERLYACINAKTHLARAGEASPEAPFTIQQAIANVQQVGGIEQRRINLEMGAGGDHDQPYLFTLPLSVPQRLAWAKLLARVRRGEIQP
ncbi:MAG TPA: hypothetical protein VKT25_09300 [Ktedonobacteraceae bacterium]|nr:hypothetical protein [Ktedonobacteraceae bacterium]